MKNINDILKRVFYVVTTIIIAIIFITAINELVISNKLNYSMRQFLFVFLVGAFLIVSLYVANKIIFLKRFYFFIVTGVFVFSIFIKYIVFLLFFKDVYPTSDYLFAYHVGAGGSFQFPYHAIFYHWIVITQIYKFVFYFFGDSVRTAIILNMVVSTIATGLLYLVAMLLFKNIKMALTTVLIFISWPSYQLYMGVLGTDQFIVLCLLSSFFFVFKWMDFLEVGNVRKSFLYLALAGLSFGITDFFKQFGIILLLAVIMASTLYFLKGKQKKIFLLAGLITMALIYIGTKAMIFPYLDQLVGIKVDRNPSIHYLVVGLDTEHDGKYNLETTRIYPNNVKKYNYNYKMAKIETKKYLKNKLELDFKKLPTLIVEKNKLTWGDDIAGGTWLIASLGKKSIPLKNLIYKINNISQLYYIGILFLMLIGSLWSIKNFNNPKLFFVNLFFVGVFFIFIISETQGRYKIPLYPIFSIMSSYGLFGVLEVVFQSNSIKNK